MSGIEGVALAIGAAVVKGAAKLWFGDKNVASDVSASAIDLATARMAGILDRRRAQRLFEDMEEIVAKRLEPLIEAEFRNLPDNERAASLIAVEQTFTAAALSGDDLFAADLDAGYLDRHLRRQVPDMPQRSHLSDDGRALYDRILRECCAYVIEITRTLPPFGPQALTVILRRESEILSQLQIALERLPERRDARDFVADYRQQVINSLDHVELFGARVEDTSRRYPLSVAYISLDLSEYDPVTRSFDNSDDVDYDVSAGTDVRRVRPSITVEKALQGGQRLFIRGDAGSGKTTLLQWIAVRCAFRDFPDWLASWNELIPFFIPLRRYAATPLPPPERFLEEVGRHIADEMPPGWVHSILRSDKGVLLIDGVDELPETRRDEARAWLRDLLFLFKKAKYIVTSRPAAVTGAWLQSDHFIPLDVQPMRPTDVTVFVNRWHAAVSQNSSDVEERAHIIEYGTTLLKTMTERRHLRDLAANPLMCALICALNRDRRAHLPDSRMELYDVALQMLLERRDSERGIEAPRLSLTEKTLLLQDVAYWLMQNGWADVDSARLIERVKSRLRSMAQVRMTPLAVSRYLLERTGLLREPVVDRIDFTHRTFQEYLAAKAAIDEDDVGFLVANAHLDRWWEVIVMSAGHAARAQREELLAGIVKRGDRTEENRSRLHLVAVASLETSAELKGSLRRLIEKRAAVLLPPTSFDQAAQLAKSGDFVIDLLLQARPPVSDMEIAASIRAAARVGGDASLGLIERYGGSAAEVIEKELIAGWSHFDPITYAQRVLSQRVRRAMWINDPSLVVALRHIDGLRELTCAFTHEYGRLDFVDALPLETLSTDDRGIDDLSPLADVPTLKRVRLHGCKRLKDLSPLAALPMLRSVEIRFCSDLIDLRPFEGKLELLVIVEGSGLVLGADQLGPGSFFNGKMVRQ